MGKGRGRGGDEDEIIGGIICVSVLAFIGIILFAVSFGTVEPNEMALNYNSNILQLDSSYLYSGGRYFLGLGHSFITYPKTIQMQEHDTAAAFQGGANRIVGRTQDGLAVEIACSIQYKFHESPGALYQSYTTFGSIDNHKTALVATARGVVRDVAAQYTAYEFFQNRSDISECFVFAAPLPYGLYTYLFLNQCIVTSMGTALNSSFYMQWADIRNFNLLNLELPSAFESAIERTINMEQ